MAGKVGKGENRVMIKVNELRIGNWFIYSDIAQSSLIGTYDKVDCDLFPICNDEIYFMNPIPLTPEILQQCGFEMDKMFKCYTIQTETGEIILSSSYILQSTDTITKLNYLHQLQNLYFALTGSELEIIL